MKNMTYGKLKKTKIYRRAQDVELCVNGESSVDEMYYPTELDSIPVVGIGCFTNKSLQIDLVCTNWNSRYEPNWVASII